MSHEKPYWKVRISVPQPDDKADTRKHQTEIGTPPSSHNLDGLEVGNYSIVHFKSDYSFLGCLSIFRNFPDLAAFHI